MTSMWQKVKVVMLPTDEANWVISYKYGGYEELQFGRRDILKSFYNPQHLYFLLPEQIKVGDYVYHTILKIVSKVTIVDKDSITVYEKNKYAGSFETKHCLKVIASTDESLTLRVKSLSGRHVDFLSPRPSDDFLRAYCKADGIDEVLIECYITGPIMQQHSQPHSNRMYTYHCDKCGHREMCIGNLQVACISEKCRVTGPIKVRLDNTIIIEEIKETFSREEVEEKLKALVEHLRYPFHHPVRQLILKSSEEWIKENL